MPLNFWRSVSVITRIIRHASINTELPYIFNYLENSQMDIRIQTTTPKNR